MATANEGSSDITIFQVASGGTLTPIAGLPFPAEGFTVNVVFSPDGKLLVSSNSNANNVSVFQVSSNGTLTTVGTFSVGASNPIDAELNPDGKLLATLNFTMNSSTVSILKVSPDGTLTIVGIFSIGTLNPSDIEFSPGGNFLATANGNSSVDDSNTVSMFCVNNNRSAFIEAMFTKYQPICSIQ